MNKLCNANITNIVLLRVSAGDYDFSRINYFQKNGVHSVPLGCNVRKDDQIRKV